MKDSSERRARAGISAIFAFLLFLCLTTVLAGTCAMGIFSESHLRSSLQNSNYIQESVRSLREALKTEAEEHGGAGKEAGNANCREHRFLSEGASSGKKREG